MLKTIPELITEAKQNLTLITAEEAKVKIHNEQAVLIDVREPSEYEQQAVTCAVNIPRGLLEMKALSLYPDENKVLLIHCASSVRACLAAEQLKRVGYNNVFVVTCSVNDICLAIS